MDEFFRSLFSRAASVLFARGLFSPEVRFCFARQPLAPSEALGTTIRRKSANRIRHSQCDNKPNTATPFWVPTYTLPLTITGVMNLFPFPKLSRPFAACVLL